MHREVASGVLCFSRPNRTLQRDKSFPSPNSVSPTGAGTLRAIGSRTRGPHVPPSPASGQANALILHKQVSQLSSHEALIRRQFAMSLAKNNGRAKEVRQSMYRSMHALGRKGRSAALHQASETGGVTLGQKNIYYYKCHNNSEQHVVCSMCRECYTQSAQQQPVVSKIARIDGSVYQSMQHSKDKRDCHPCCNACMPQQQLLVCVSLIVSCHDRQLRADESPFPAPK